MTGKTGGKSVVQLNMQKRVITAMKWTDFFKANKNGVTQGSRKMQFP